MTIETHVGSINCLINSSNNQFLSASKDGEINVFDNTTYECLKTLNIHTKSVNHLILSKDQSRFFSASPDNTIKCVNMESFELLATYQGNHGIVYKF